MILIVSIILDRHNKAFCQPLGNIINCVFPIVCYIHTQYKVGISGIKVKRFSKLWFFQGLESWYLGISVFSSFNTFATKF